MMTVLLKNIGYNFLLCYIMYMPYDIGKPQGGLIGIFPQVFTMHVQPVHQHEWESRNPKKLWRATGETIDHQE